MRIAIVNEVATTAEALRRIVAGMPGHRVAWMAADGAEAVERCRQDTPDLILMDLMGQGMDGAEATRRIMAESPCPILVVTPTVEERSAKVYEALGAGALDAVQTPELGGSRQQQGIAALRFKIEAIRRLVPGGSGLVSNGAPGEKQRQPAACNHLVAIGASAGGPAALATILGGLPHDFPAPIVIVQHVDARFVPWLANWLTGYSGVPVRVAEDGDQPKPGIALIAGTNSHLVFANASSLAYTENPADCHQRPSVDVFFDSIVRHWRGDVAGVLLTGMGRDGARGLKALRGAGFLTIAQDAVTCAVYGMPMAAVELRAAVKILPVEEIARQLIDYAALHKSAQ